MMNKQIPLSHKGRVCKVRECKRVLSVYNHEVYCHIHLQQKQKMPTSAGSGKALVFEN